MKRDDGITLLAVYFFVVAGLIMLGALAILIIPLAPLLFSPMPPNAAAVLILVVGLLFLIMGVLAALYLITGIGLLRHREWARWIAIVLSVLSLPNFPVGTVIGGLTLWFLLRDDVQAAFREG